MVNNRLKVYGGEGTYMTSVGDELIRQGHDVQYFGLIDEDGLHGNKYRIYAKKSYNPFRLIRNDYNRRQFARILDVFDPDIIHLNLIYFTLTPAILIEAHKRNIPVVQTIHDGKIVCPSYQLYIHNQDRPCTQCVDGAFWRCVKKKCHKDSVAFSFIAYKEAVYNRKRGYYDYIDYFIFPSRFMRDIHVKFGIPEEKTNVICNFSRIQKRTSLNKADKKYVLFFGRVIRIKGVEVLLETVKKLPNIQFVIVGNGDMVGCFDGIHNCSLLGFKSGKELERIISEATCAVFPSVCYENCPMSIQESIALGTPVIGANIGGIPELIKDGVTGYIVESGNSSELAVRIEQIYNDEKLAEELANNCLKEDSLTNSSQYVTKLVERYQYIINK